MNYPTLDEIQNANIALLEAWLRNLPSPGIKAVGQPNFRTTTEAQGKLLDAIIERYYDLGGRDS